MMIAGCLHLNLLHMKKVLIIEDDANLVELLSIHLSDLGCQLHIARDGQEGLARALQTNLDLIVLDLMLPGIDGLEICRQVRMAKRDTLIIMLTARSEEIDRVLGLELGADDYLTKPFSVREFIARVKGLFRRSEHTTFQHSLGQSSDPLHLHFGELEIDLNLRRVSQAGQRIELSPKEFELLALLAASPGKSYDRHQLLNLVWGYDFTGYEHTVNSHINRLRGKIEPDAANPRYILTTWGVGYRFNEAL